jgi:putative hemolysin
VSHAVQLRVAQAVATAVRQYALGRYSLTIAQTEEEVRSALQLRYQVFNLELKEGLASSHGTSEDRDQFDEVMHHLIVRDSQSGQVVGTYRLQTGNAAARNLGYYSAREFEFAPYESRRAAVLELGRACIHATHRNLIVLSLLWRGIATYALAQDCHLLIGCSSLTSQDPEEGVAAYHMLRNHEAGPELQTHPMPEFKSPRVDEVRRLAKIPKLLRAYLSVGARIAGPPAIDREFKTIDFLTILDLQQVPSGVQSRFLSF